MYLEHHQEAKSLNAGLNLFGGGSSANLPNDVIAAEVTNPDVAFIADFFASLFSSSLIYSYSEMVNFSRVQDF